ncbi:hypothetical protein [Methanothrix sp.]|uniref:hypothetical protein n=1 Tax=Methanothrix sp. TaxID=90426 RepID=UPI003BB4BB1F
MAASSNQLVVLLEMIRVASKALSESLVYLQQKTILQRCPGTKRLLSRLLYQNDNIHLKDDLAGRQDIEYIPNLHP